MFVRMSKGTRKAPRFFIRWCTPAYIPIHDVKFDIIESQSFSTHLRCIVNERIRETVETTSATYHDDLAVRLVLLPTLVYGHRLRLVCILFDWHCEVTYCLRQGVPGKPLKS